MGGVVVLRWKTQAASGGESPRSVAAPSASEAFATGSSPGGAAFEQSDAMVAATSGRGAAVPASTSNPLRMEVRQVAYQQDSHGNPQAAFPEQGFAPPALPSQPAIPSLPREQALPSDPLDTPEPPPPPSGVDPRNGERSDLLPPPAGSRGSASGSILEGRTPPNPFPERAQRPSPSDRLNGDVELLPPGQVEGDFPERRSAEASFRSCDELRSQLQSNPLTSVSLDISPAFGEGLRGDGQTAERMRLDFAASSEVRTWTDYRGVEIARGRMIDLRHGRVVIDMDGEEFAISLNDLSDVDTTYVGNAWNTPDRCGTGYEPFQGRQYVASTVQFKASGLCHKPLYFEQMQLERYGHEIGPVLQPLVSTAHFFATIPVLPYKMGIHPPNECQYALGYYRPGDCAPYMLRPIPWSLRGAAVQAGAVTGAAALIP